MTVNDKILAYEPMIHSIIHKLNIIYDTDEYMQIGRLAVLESIKKFDSSKSACTEAQFVYTLIRQRLIDEIRKVARYQSRVLPASDHAVFYNSITDDYTTEHPAAGNLNKREERWLTLTLKGYALTEVAAELSVSVSTAKNIRRSAREKLKVYFDK
ncbi:RNA polymerase sigma factor SigS [Jeotgalicoccus aerolatus]|uniref:RNA polymerase sigma factor SigS n=1 Tax=Jeotgalicoccus aerolatus TaxID=709510 RepID=A0A1G8VSW0_9STAP|nr:sigma-70 family RNA polymerase sigma factor [Jeotgalicoccus aerolatus]MBP1951306.1 RNA polymerase sigma factor (sigma-70 family) [Jeotgalicoccus aerolatus]NMA80817.1 sigma-70 family RNA polymerase sigma factor [Jeotgalicoccus aerolatus]CAD2077221.1 RNA polymerase sigma factor SigS [Jeotgalicoccus aerolatus]SDJ69198.1 RNA polymerase sigma factor, sigma-70 family [Jeotgalicoccus aerolatus]GGD98521.1 hypothetical protein GCM10007273_08720 [Jeotgalicoccus aerolatus]